MKTKDNTGRQEEDNFFDINRDQNRGRGMGMNNNSESNIRMDFSNNSQKCIVTWSMRGEIDVTKHC